MKAARWIEHPRMLALFAFAFALVPAGIAFLTFRSARDKDTKLYATAAQVLGEQLQLNTVRHISFLNVLRNQWRNTPSLVSPPDYVLPPPLWQSRMPHLLTFAFAADEDGRAPLRWIHPGPCRPVPENTDLMTDARYAPALRQAAGTSALIAVGAPLEPGRLAIVEAVTDYERRLRGWMIGWLDLDSITRDASLPLLRDGILAATPDTGAQPPGADAHLALLKEGEVQWRAVITRGPHFTREYGAPTPWLGFAALSLSALPLTALVVLASRAGKLRAALDAERELGRMRDHFIHSVSHEFRTPLSVILSGADLLENYATQLAPPRRDAVFAQIRDCTRHMNEMVEQLLLLGRIEANSLKASPQPVNVATLCGDIARETATATLDRCPVEVGAPDREVSLDATLLRGILGNLLSNAVKYSTPGKPVRLDVTDAGGKITFTVRDEGLGIPAVDLPRVCQPFHRGANAGGIPGTGLGLAIVEKCAALHGGTLRIESCEGAGTTATVVLPSP